MAIVNKQVTYPAKTHTVLDYVTCELCSTTAKDSDNWKGKSSYDVDGVEVRFKTGESYPEGSNVEHVVLDICPECFKSKLIPWFEAQGGKVRREDHGW